MSNPNPAEPALRPESSAVHVSMPDTAISTPVGVPLYQGHTFSFADAGELADAFAGENDAFMYGRLGNPTVRALEDAIAGLEGGAAALATSSGMGAISSTLWALLRPGDHVVAQRRLYGGTTAFLEGLRERWGVDVEYVAGDDPAAFRAALRPTTRVLYLETITNPTCQVLDLPALFGIARAAGVTSVVDNTFATPLLYRPIADGADVVVHSTTKYLSGHSDIVGGMVVFADEATERTVRGRAVEYGATPDPFAAWLTIRGLNTLAVRMRAHCANAETLAERLAGHPAVSAVHYPALASHPDHAVARRLLPDGCGGVLAFDVADPSGVPAFARSLRMVLLTASLGTVKTQVMPPATTSHRKLGPEELAASGIGPGTVRLSVGIEHVEDVWADLEQALDAARKAAA